MLTIKNVFIYWDTTDRTQRFNFEKIKQEKKLYSDQESAEAAAADAAEHQDDGRGHDGHPLRQPAGQPRGAQHLGQRDHQPHGGHRLQAARAVPAVSCVCAVFIVLRYI